MVDGRLATATTVVFNVERDVELDDFSMDGGAFFKRGTYVQRRKVERVLEKINSVQVAKK